MLVTTTNQPNWGWYQLDCLMLALAEPVFQQNFLQF